MKQFLLVGGLLLAFAAVATASPSGVSFPAQSCWVRRPNPGYPPVRPIRSAPSVLAPAPKHPVDPATLVRETLRRFGDTTMFRSGRTGEIPSVVRQHRRGWFGPAPQPKHPLWVYFDAPPLSTDGKQSPDAVVRGSREQWELSLLAGALHDEACEARTDPIVGVSLAHAAAPELTVFMSGGPFGQRFPNLPQPVLRGRAERVAREFHARLVAMWFLHPLQLAPVMIFEASDKRRFIQTFAAMDAQLGLRSGENQRYEGVFIEAVDNKHVPFMLTWSIARGQLGGGQWSSDHCHYPFDTAGGGPGMKAGCNG